MLGLYGSGQIGGGCPASPNCTCLRVLILLAGAGKRNTMALIDLWSTKKSYVVSVPSLGCRVPTVTVINQSHVDTNYQIIMNATTQGQISDYKLSVVTLIRTPTHWHHVPQPLEQTGVYSRLRSLTVVLLSPLR